MNTEFVKRNLRILVIDDNRAIHDDFRKILCEEVTNTSLDRVEAALFDEPMTSKKRVTYEIDSASQGKEGLEKVQAAVANGRPYALAFIDIRMPPGWDGIEAATRIWELQPDLQIVVCTAYSDYSWDQMSTKLGHSDQLLILKKPFDTVEVLQLTTALTAKWRLQQEAKLKVDGLEELVRERTRIIWETNENLQREVVERKKAAEALREQAMLLDLAQDAIFIHDLNGNIQLWNQGAERLYGIPRVEAIGNSLALLFPKDDPKVMQVIEQMLLQAGEWSGEMRKHNRRGEELVVNSRRTLLKDAAGQPQSVLVINTDITEKKRLEAQFLRSQRMEGIGTLATGMAHDLNNILAPILMSAGMLRWDLSAAEKEETLSRIEMSAQRGAEIIQQVLTFGRGVKGEWVAMHPSALLEETGRIVRQTFPKNLLIQIESSVRSLVVMGDKTQMHQVLLNLCINARDAMRHGGQLTVSARNVVLDQEAVSLYPPAQPGSYVVFEVADTGCGIAPSDLERIFDPFFTTKELGKGTGLGLSTALGIVKSHQGFITVKSELNKGSAFKVFLPARSESGEMLKQQPSVGMISRGAGETILIVDDEKEIVSVNRKMLERHGYKVLVASDGIEGLAVFGKHRGSIEVVLTDIMMPNMDGIALAHGLREIDRNVEIIASSGLDKGLKGGSRGAELKALGVKFFLSKPYHGEKLLATLQEAIQSRKASKAVERSVLN